MSRFAARINALSERLDGCRTICAKCAAATMIANDTSTMNANDLSDPMSHCDRRPVNWADALAAVLNEPSGPG